MKNSKWWVYVTLVCLITTSSFANPNKRKKNSESSDVPEVSFPETVNCKIENQQALIHLTWSVTAPESLFFTEVQYSSDGINFQTVGIVFQNEQSNSYDYFVPVENKGKGFVRFMHVEYNSFTHLSEVMKL
jgi:hypothetical protein